MSSLTDTSSGSTLSAQWVGTATSGSEQLQLTQTVSFDADDLYFVINVNMVNTGTTTLNSVEYMRNVDPDQEQPWSGGSFTTRNWVEFQPPRPASGSRVFLAARPAGNTDKALSIAEGRKWGLTLGLGTFDSRAVVAASHGFSNRDTDGILNTPNQPTPTSPSIADAAIVLAYELGSLAPGQSTSFDYVYILNKDDLEVALGALAAVTILQPTGTVSGSGVIFQTTTDDVPNTSKIDFYVNGALVGSDVTPTGSGIFETTFDSLTLANGPVSLKAIAVISGNNAEKTGSVIVDNSGPPISFSTPSTGDTFSGTGIPIGMVINPAQPPVSISFFRETAGTGSISLGADTSAPFTSSFDVTDLPDGETVVIKAVGTDALGRRTTITVSGTVVLNQTPTADASATVTLYDTNASSCDASVTLDGSLSSDPDSGDTLTYTWTWSGESASGVSPSISLPKGTTNVNLVVNDGTVDSTSDTVFITVEDNTAPVPDASGLSTVTGECSATILATPTATDNCAGSVLGTTTDPLEYTAQGTFTVTWTFADGNGNSVTQPQTVVVDDITAPVPDAAGLTTVTGECSATISATPTATDNCAGSVLGTTPDPLTYTEQGTYTVTWTFADGNGNSVTQPQTVIVDDITAPVVTVILEPVKVKKKHGCFRVVLFAEDNCDVIDPSSITATFNGNEDVVVFNGDLVKLHNKLGKKGCRVKASDDNSSAGCATVNGGTVKVECDTFILTATVADNAGNVGTGSNVEQPVFSSKHDHRHDGRSHDGHSHGGKK